MANTIDHVTLLFAILSRGAVAFVSNPHDPIQKLIDTLETFSPYALFADRASVLATEKRLGESAQTSLFSIDESPVFGMRFHDNDLALSDYDPRMCDAQIAIFSSGSTGEPKAIIHRTESLLRNASLHSEAIGLRDADIVGVLLPLFYSYGLVANLFSSLITGSHAQIHFQSGNIDADWIHQRRISTLSITPYFSSTLSRSIPSLRVLTLGGDVLHSKQAEHLMRTLPSCDLFTTYGLTEAGPRVATWHLDRELLPESSTAPLGRPLTGVQLSLHGRRDSSSSADELVVDTPTRMIGYYFGRERGFAPANDASERIHTGDLFEERDGELYFVGRSKNIIIQGGEKLFPVVIESAIQALDGVREVKVSGVAHRDKGQVAKAYVVADKGVSIGMIKKSLMHRFSRSLIPEQIELVGSISRTLTGKARA